MTKPPLQLESLQQLKALTHPLRLQILQLFSGPEPLSVQMIAQRLEQPHGKVHYHVRELVQHGFLEEVEGRIINGIQERLYSFSGPGFEAATNMFDTEEWRTAISQTRQSVLNHIHHMISENAAKHPSIMITLKELYITAAEKDDLPAKIDALLAPYTVQRPGLQPEPYMALLFGGSTEKDSANVDPSIDEKKGCEHDKKESSSES
ncbi:MAG TPA: hypothetical protein DF292_08935 [Firmicutes bacterium]|jgi:DNA-binding transcriptional ArsR family regulator|nr:hypothetical protein [Bacillota bacterium]